eukprot:30109-Pelagococcus_subviridis.AAC.5
MTSTRRATTTGYLTQLRRGRAPRLLGLLGLLPLLLPSPPLLRRRARGRARGRRRRRRRVAVARVVVARGIVPPPLFLPPPSPRRLVPRALLLPQPRPRLVRLRVQRELRRGLELRLELHRFRLLLELRGDARGGDRAERRLCLIADVVERRVERHVRALLHGHDRVRLPLAADERADAGHRGEKIVAFVRARPGGGAARLPCRAGGCAARRSPRFRELANTRDESLFVVADGRCLCR